MEDLSYHCEDVPESAKIINNRHPAGPSAPPTQTDEE